MQLSSWQCLFFRVYYQFVTAAAAAVVNILDRQQHYPALHKPCSHGGEMSGAQQPRTNGVFRQASAAAVGIFQQNPTAICLSVTDADRIHQHVHGDLLASIHVVLAVNISPHGPTA